MAALAVGLAVFYYFTGAANALPIRLVPSLEAVPLTLESIAAGPVQLPVQVSGFIVSLTHDVVGPFTQPVAATLFLVLLAVVLIGWTAVVSTLERTPFVAGMVPVIFLLLSLNTEQLGIFATGERYFLYLMLGLVGGGAFGLHAFAERMPLLWRTVVMTAIVAGVTGVLFAQSDLPASETVLHLAAYATPAGAVLFVLTVLWVGVENVRALLWFNTQAEQPSSRHGLWPFVATSLLYLGVLLLYVWNNGTVELFFGIHLDPLVLLLPALLTGGLGLRLRAPSYGPWVPYARGMAQLYPLLVMGAAGELAYVLATDNTPLLVAARSFTGLALLLVGGAFWLYVLINFMPLIQRRLRVYRVLFEPRRLPFYTVYILAILGIVMIQSRQGFALLDQLQAGQYNHLADLTRQQSEAAPDDLSLAVLAERYYAESGDVLYRANLHAQFGRAALYRFRQQRQNEINALTRGLLRGPNEKVSLRLARLYNEPTDLFEGLEILRRGLKGQPQSAPLASDLAQLFTQTALTDSVAFYLDKAEQLAPGNYASRTNQLGFLLKQELYPAAQKLATGDANPATEPAFTANQLLYTLFTKPAKVADVSAAPVAELDDASFAQLYHRALIDIKTRNKAGLNQLLRPLTQLTSDSANAAYYEQLMFLQALARHALSQEKTARELLLPLATGTTPTAAYYQQLLGLWQLQQGQYATAADQLAFAAGHGATSATAARVYALALSGRTDSARAIATRLAASPDSTQKQLGRQALQQVVAGNFTVGTAGSRVGNDWLGQAQRAEQGNNVAEATKNYQRIVREAPFNEAAVLAAGRFYTQRKDYAAAYAALRAGLDENPSSLPLLRAYVLTAADAGLTDYAADALAQLRLQLPPAAYATLAAEYAARRTARAAANSTFSGTSVSPSLQ